MNKNTAPALRPTERITFVSAWSIVTFFGLIIYKRYLLGYGHPFYLDIANDVLLLSLMFVLSIRRSGAFAQKLQIAAALSLIIFHWADTCVIIAIDNKLTWNSFVAHYKYFDTFYYFISPTLLIFTGIMIFLPILLWKKRIKLPFYPSSVNAIGCQLVIFSLLASIILKHTTSDVLGGDGVLNLGDTSFSAHEVTSKTRENIQTQYPELLNRINNIFNGAEWLSPLDINVQKPNIVIVLSESLSGVDSKYAGGRYNRLPNIDKIQKEGVTFKAASSNGKTTVHGLASLLLALQPLKTGGYGSASAQFPPDKFFQNNVIAYAKKAGYRTIIISPGAKPTWEGLADWFHKIGFDTIYTRDAPEFANVPRYTWDAPSDEAMYAVAEHLVSKEQSPYLLIIETIGLRQPYILPDSRYRISDSLLLNQIHYVDQTTYKFYENLKQRGFFQNGVFILLGDHRRFEPLEKEELRNGGFARWHEGIVSAMVGKGIMPGSFIEAPFSLTDVNTLLHFIISGKTIDQHTILQANLGIRLGYNTPFSMTLADEANGGYLIRSQKYRPMYFSIFGKAPLEDIPNLPYKGAVIYLIENDQRVKKVLEE